MTDIKDIVGSKALLYKKKIANSFALVQGDQIKEKVHGSSFFVTKKVDGVMQIVFVSDGQVCSSSKSGVILENQPCLDEVLSLCNKAGIKNGVFAAELYVRHKDGKRERVPEVKSMLSGTIPNEGDELCLATFDILEIEGEKYEADKYADTYTKLSDIFKGRNLVSPVEAKEAQSLGEVEALYDEWVVQNGGEGLVVHPDVAIVYKIKPNHSIDGAIVGYTTQDDDENSIRDLMVAMMREDGKWQVVGQCGNGLTAEDRKAIFVMLANKSVESEFIATDSRSVAYQMIRPEIVAEFTATDFLTENVIGEARMNPLLSYDEQSGFKSEGQTAGVSPIFMRFDRIRDDKKADSTDTRISQLTNIVSFAEVQELPLSDMPESEIIARKVYKKGEGAKLSVHKFVVLKTNKEQTGRFPAYILHHTDFSCGRKEPLKRDMRISSSESQILELLEQFIAENIKKGWSEVEA